MQPMDYPVIPWHAVPLTILGLHLYYSCVNQALVQRSFGAKTEWDARMAIIVSGFFVMLRPFVEILPGMICRALGTFDPVFNLDAVRKARLTKLAFESDAVVLTFKISHKKKK